jgi:hypothetical protein
MEKEVVYGLNVDPTAAQPSVEIHPQHTQVVDASITLYRYGKKQWGYSSYSDAWTMKIPEARRLYEQLGKALGEVGE